MMTFRAEIVISDLLKDFDKMQIKCPKCNGDRGTRLGGFVTTPISDARAGQLLSWISRRAIPKGPRPADAVNPLTGCVKR